MDLSTRLAQGRTLSLCFLVLRSIGLSGSLDADIIYIPSLREGVAAILQRLDAIDGRLDAIERRLDHIENCIGTPEDHLDGVDRGTIWDTIQINNALTLNHRTIARNRENVPHCEPLRKTVSSLPFLINCIFTTSSRSQVMISTMSLLSHEQWTDKAWLYPLSRHPLGLCHPTSIQTSVATQRRIFQSS